MSLRKTSLLLLAVLLSGCTTTPVVKHEELILPWPTPMMICNLETITVDSDGRISMSYQDNINIAVCERDMFRYIKDLSKMICIHQPEDKRCKELK